MIVVVFGGFSNSTGDSGKTECLDKRYYDDESVDMGR